MIPSDTETSLMRTRCVSDRHSVKCTVFMDERVCYVISCQLFQHPYCPLSAMATSG